MIVKEDLEKRFLKSLHGQSLFQKNFLNFIEKGFCKKNRNSVTEMTYLGHGSTSKKYIHYFEYVNKVGISGVIGLKYRSKILLFIKRSNHKEKRK